LPLPNQGNYLPQVRKELKICEAKSDKSSIDEPLEIKLKDLPPHLEYAFLEGDDKLPVIIAKYLTMEVKTALITVLKSHKQAIAWKLSDIKGIDPEFCTHKILMEEDFEPAIQHQRRVNTKIHDVIKNEVLKLFDTGLIYPISDIPWEKSHFMVKEGIVIGHKISKEGIEVDKAKVDFITKLPHPTTVKGIRSFLGHTGFYQRFIQDFSNIARPMTRLLKKDTPFLFFKKCVEAFQTLKRKLTEAPILIAPDWDMPFELMCDDSDFAIVLGQHQEKHFRPIHYASKTMTEAESNYTTTEKEMLAVVYAFEKFRSYLIMNKSIVLPLKFSRLVTMDPPRDIMAQITQPRREPDQGKYKPLPEVKGKGKEKVGAVQAVEVLLNLQTGKKKSPTDRYILQKRSKEPTKSSGRGESLLLYAELGLSDSDTESDEINPAVIRSEYKEEDQAGSDPGKQAEGQAGPNPGVIPMSWNQCIMNEHKRVFIAYLIKD
nr:DNA-directed DNA polymerase [Tanacetum cinerariifolium]